MEKSVADLVISHQQWLRRIARRFYQSEPDIEDLTSETMCKCLTHAHRFDSTKEFRKWAYTIMANTFRSHYRHGKHIQFCSYDTCAPVMADNHADQRARVRRILSIIRECRKYSICIDCVVLYAKGYSYEEISREIEIPVGTVRSRISAGRKILLRAMM